RAGSEEPLEALESHRDLGGCRERERDEKPDGEGDPMSAHAGLLTTPRTSAFDLSGDIPIGSDVDRARHSSRRDVLFVASAAIDAALKAVVLRSDMDVRDRLVAENSQRGGREISSGDDLARVVADPVVGSVAPDDRGVHVVEPEGQGVAVVA